MFRKIYFEKREKILITKFFKFINIIFIFIALFFISTKIFSYLDFKLLTYIINFDKLDKDKPIIVIPLCLDTENKIENFKKMIESLNFSFFFGTILFSDNCRNGNIKEIIKELDQRKIYMNIAYDFFDLTYYYNKKYFYTKHIDFLLHTIFDVLKFNHIIFLEPDILVSVDFYSFFNCKLRKDHSGYFIINGYNENSKEENLNNFLEIDESKKEFSKYGWAIRRNEWVEYIKDNLSHPGDFYQRIKEIEKKFNLISISPKMSKIKRLDIEDNTFIKEDYFIFECPLDF